jgi:peptidoglycan/xylan/chitin deacetylase (PgdA/CDA1 family)
MSVNRVTLAAQALHRSRGGALLRRVPAWRGILVLNYHRIGDARQAPYFPDVFSATPDDFDRQLAFLARNADVIGGDDLPFALSARRGRHLLITFDDGYRDNYELAYPLLRQHGLTAVFFLCTGFLDGQGPAWWDEIAWIIRTSPRREIALPAWLPTPLLLGDGDRQHAIAVAIAAYRRLPGDQAPAFVQHLADAAGTGRLEPSATADLWMSWDMARAMRAGGMTIGGHTVSHPILARLSAQQQLAEIAGCRDRIAKELGEAPRLFAYPVGKPGTFNAETRAALHAAGFAYAFSFYGGHQPFDPLDPYDIRRTFVDWKTTLPWFEAKVMLPTVFARW